mgnify:CR=1 FL=1
MENMSIEDLVNEYVKSLSVNEIKTMETAHRLLGMTFDIKKSNVFIKWLNSRK